VPDVDENGFTILREVGIELAQGDRQQYFYSAKVTGAVTPDHQGSVAVMGSPSVARNYCPFDTCSNNGVESATRQVVNRNIMDIASSGRRSSSTTRPRSTRSSVTTTTSSTCSLASRATAPATE
jgi:hypothetical protein